MFHTVEGEHKLKLGTINKALAQLTMQLACGALTLAASTMRAVASASSLAAASNFLELSTSISASASDLMALTRSEVAWASTRAWRTISPADANEGRLTHNRTVVPVNPTSLCLPLVQFCLSNLELSPSSWASLFTGRCYDGVTTPTPAPGAIEHVDPLVPLHSGWAPSSYFNCLPDPTPTCSLTPAVASWRAKRPAGGGTSLPGLTGWSRLRNVSWWRRGTHPTEGHF